MRVSNPSGNKSTRIHQFGKTEFDLLGLTAEDFLACFVGRNTMRGDPCYICNGTGTTFDHIEPRRNGRLRSAPHTNLARACYPCNHEKGAGSLVVFLARRRARTFVIEEQRESIREEVARLRRERELRSDEARRKIAERRERRARRGSEGTRSDV